MTLALDNYRSHFNVMMIQAEAIDALKRDEEQPGLNITSIGLLFDSLVNVIADRSEFRYQKAGGKTRAFEAAVGLFDEFKERVNKGDPTDIQKVALARIGRAVAMVQHQYPDAFPVRTVFA